eukprot:3204719-Ditylum_brightwellii.AAC.1
MNLSLEWNHISAKTILKHKDQLSVKHHENFLQTKLHEDLVSQYQLEDPPLRGVLLLPRAEKKVDCYMSCTTCKSALISSRVREKPPRLAIATVWMIGHIPESVVHPISTILSAMIAPI